MKRLEDKICRDVTNLIHSLLFTLIKCESENNIWILFLRAMSSFRHKIDAVIIAILLLFQVTRTSVNESYNSNNIPFKVLMTRYLVSFLFTYQVALKKCFFKHSKQFLTNSLEHSNIQSSALENIKSDHFSSKKTTLEPSENGFFHTRDCQPKIGKNNERLKRSIFSSLAKITFVYLDNHC